MKQFNLEEYLKNPLKKVVTRRGKNVRIICVDRKARYCVVGLISIDSDFEEVACYTENGECTEGAVKPFDLLFAPEKHEGWVNVYRDLGSGELYCGYVYDSEEEAKKRGGIATVKIEWEE